MDGNFSSSLKVSVIICTKNRFEDLHFCLNSIIKQTYPVYELIIIDSSENNFINSFYESFQVPAGCNKKYYHKYMSLTQARNFGVKNSEGEIVLFVDDDVVLDKNYILNIIKTYLLCDKSNCGGFTGNITNQTKIRWHSFLYENFFFLFCFKGGNFQPSGWPTFIQHTTEVKNIECLSGSNMAFDRKIFDEFKFDEKLTGYCAMEDADFAYRISRKHTNYYVPEAKLIHNCSQISRDNMFAKTKMLTQNHRYIFNKNFAHNIRNTFAFWWSYVGLIILFLIQRNRAGILGTISGLRCKINYQNENKL